MNENDHATEGLSLEKGGKLVYTCWDYDETSEKGSYKSHDVTAEACTFLCELCRPEDSVTLADILMLVRGDEILQLVFSREWARELIEEAFSGETAPAPAEYSPETIEYLEIYQRWGFNSRTKAYEPHQLPGFHGVGVKLREDHYEGGTLTGRKGERIHWALSFMSPCDLMNLPVRINPTVLITEADTEADNYARTVSEARYETLTLYQVLRAVLWELTWHGPPEDREARRREVMDAAREVREHPERLVEADLDSSIQTSSPTRKGRTSPPK